jgi:peptide-methionine (S)-S-oxide reductase
METTHSRKVATLGGGCFWCTEEVFKNVQGVLSVESGYSGGHTENPTYKEVCSGKTDHAEVVQVTYDPGVISFREILEIFFGTHDPTTLNRQGADVGSQYRSIVLYHDEEQRKTTEEIIQQLEKEKTFAKHIVTEVKAFEVFYRAEIYHQDYYERNRRQPYCRLVITPKIEKLRKQFTEKLKHEN